MMSNNDPIALFHDSKHQVLARAIKTVIDKDSNLSEASIEDQIALSGNESMIPEPREFMINLQANSSISNFNDLKDNVVILIERDKSRRQLRDVEEIRSEIVNDNLPPNETAKRLQAASTNNLMSKDVETAGDRLVRLMSGDEEAPWTVPTNFKHIDDSTNGGFSAGRVYVWAARPKVGKTTLLTNVETNLLENGAVVISVSLEVNERDFMINHIAAIGILNRHSVGEVMYGNKTPEQAFDEPEDVEYFANAVKFLSDAPFYPMFINDTMNGFQSIISAVATIKAKHPGKPVVLTVDYLQLQVQNQFNQLSELSQLTRDYKVMAMEQEIAVVYLSQLNRQGADGSMPSTAYLRGSGTIEQDADWVAMLNRKSLYNELNETDYPDHVMDVSVQLNRQSRNVNFKLHWDGSTNSVSDPEDGYDFEDDD